MEERMAMCAPLRGSLIAFLCDGWETALRAVSQPSHKNIMSEPRSGEEFPNSIKFGMTHKPTHFTP
jgi:hypothetical protein